MRRCILDSHNTREPMGLMMIDVDEFKYINDAFGHVEGRQGAESHSGYPARLLCRQPLYCPLRPAMNLLLCSETAAGSK